MLGLGLSLQKGVSAFNAGRALVSSYIRRVTDAGGVLQNTACDVAAINELNQDRLLDPASWVLVPDGIKEDVVYAQKPSSGLGDLVMTRASDATYTDASGVVRRSPYNLLQQSEMFSNAIWSKSDSTISIDAAVAPNGTQTADRLFETAVSGNHGFYQELTLLTGRSYTLTCYVKRGNRDFCGLQFYFNVNNGAIAFFNLATGTLVYEFAEGAGYSVTSSTIQDVGSGWFRLSAVFTTGQTQSYPGVVLASTQWTTGTSYDNLYTGDVTRYIDTWGAQLVEGTSALDYFPTTNRQDVPRIDFRNADGTLSSCGRLLLEPQRTNSIRNSSMVGAVAGTPGTLPTNYAVTTSGGLTRSVVAIGTENGLPYIDLRFNGTATGTVRLDLETTTAIAATNAQTWSYSTYAKVISGTMPITSLVMFERTPAGVYIIDAATAFTPTSNLQRFNFTRALTGGATVGAVQPSLYLSAVNGQTYDFTIRIAAPQMELGAYATTWVPTTTAAVTRLVDTASKTGVSSLIGQTEGTLFVEANVSQLQGAVARTFIDIGSTNNRVFVGFTSLASNTMRLQIETALGTRVDFRAVVSSPGTIKVAAAYKDGDCALYVNGVAGTLVANNSISFTTISNLFLGQTIVSSAILADGIAQAALFPTRLTNDQLEVLTSEGYGNYALLAQSLNCVLQ